MPSKLLEELTAINGAFDGAIRRAGELNAVRIAPTILSPSAPQGGGLPGGQGGDGAIPSRGPGRQGDGSNLENRAAAGSLLGAPATPPAGSGATISSGGGSTLGGGASGAATVSGSAAAGAPGGGGNSVLGAGESWGILVAIGERMVLVPGFPPGDPASVGRPVSTKYELGGAPGRPPEMVEMNGFDCSLALTWPINARTIYWRVPETPEVGSRMSGKGSGGSTGKGSGSQRWMLSGNGVNTGVVWDRGDGGNKGSIGDVVTNPGMRSMTGKDSAAIVGAVGAVVEELRQIRRDSKSSGIALRAGGLA